MGYSYDIFANLAARTDNLRNLEETFTYDHLNRLTDIWLNNAHTGHMAYDALGRMTDKRTDGQQVFSAAQHDYIGPDGQLRPHAISSATVEDNPFPTAQQSITYTMFDKVKRISTHQHKSFGYDYGYDHQRIRQVSSQILSTRIKTYIGNSERIDEASKSPVYRTYLSGPMGVFAVAEMKDGEGSVHYVLKDHLGSWTTITDANGNIEQEVSFDAWGNPRDAETWSGSYNGALMFDRGFTGHEHVYYNSDNFNTLWFDIGLINMNGRMYDPIMSSFLSVDNYVQAPDFSQSFNRYAYCLNNPLKYTDPSGELFGIDDIMFCMIVSGISSVLINGVVNSCAGRNFYDGSYGAFMGGITATAMGGVMGGAVSKLVGVGGFVPRGIVQGTGGLFGGYAGGAVGAWCNGGSLRDCMTAGLTGGAIGLGTGFVLGGIQGGIYAMKNGGNFWSGAGIEYTRNAAPSSPWDVEMQKGMEYSTKFLNSFKETNGLDIDVPSNLSESYADGVTISKKSKYHYKGSWLTDSKEVEKIYATTVNVGFGKYNTYYAQAAFSCPEELYLTIQHEYFHLELFKLGYTQDSQANKDFHHASISRFEYDQAVLWKYRVGYYWAERHKYAKYINSNEFINYKDYLYPITNRPLIPKP